MFPYKRQFILMSNEKICLFIYRASGKKGSIKEETLDDEDENSDEGDEEDYTVYECHGLAPVSSLENASDDQTNQTHSKKSSTCDLHLRYFIV